MKIAILECQTLPVERSRVFGEYSDMFKKLFSTCPNIQSGHHQIEFDVFDVRYHENYPSDLDQYDAFLCTGSLSSVYDEDAWILDLKQFLKDLLIQGRKIIGVCFGHQIMAEVLGGKVSKAKVGWGLGVHQYKVTDLSQDWMEPKQTDIRLVVSHQDQVVDFPKGANPIAGSEFCPYAMYTYADQVLCMQFHPEFELAYSDMSLAAKVSELPKELIDTARASLTNEPDQCLIANWIYQFLTKTKSPV